MNWNDVERIIAVSLTELDVVQLFAFDTNEFRSWDATIALLCKNNSLDKLKQIFTGLLIQ